MLSRDGEASRSEWAIYIALTLFALHQQGKDLKRESVNTKGKGLGSAVAELVKTEEDRQRVWKRFQTIATSSDVRELGYHLRSMIQLLKADGISLDYGVLAKDIFDYQDSNRVNAVRLKWGEDFYRQKKEETDEQ